MLRYINIDIKSFINLIKQNPELRSEVVSALESSDTAPHTKPIGFASGELSGKVFLGGTLDNPWRTNGCLALTVREMPAAVKPAPARAESLRRKASSSQPEPARRLTAEQEAVQDALYWDKWSKT